MTLGDSKSVAAGDRDLVFARYAPGAATPGVLIGVGDGATWPGLPPVTATGPEDLLLLRFTPGS